VCIFCHAPHHTSGTRPLWNREMSLASYRIYESSTMDAKPGQPTGASKLCLSCHDGTIALGSVLSRTDRIRMGTGDFMPAGLTNLGTDLSDDHPISFHYTSGLAAADRQLANPRALPAEVKLDDTGQLQCTACHDPHKNLHGKFLVMRPEFGALCTACHSMAGWRTCAHRSSNAAVSGSASGDWPYTTVAENACRSCHRSHTAGGHERLLIFENEEDNCLSCHDGQVARINIRAELDKPSAHDPRRYVGVHDPVERPGGERPHVECVDCHNPHAVSAEPVSGVYVPIGATLAKSRGVSTSGAQLDEARHEYEVCFRCHGEYAVEVPRRIQRQAQHGDMRLKFSPSNPSYHPVVAPAASRDMLTLTPGLAPGSMIRCTDCHNNDDGPRAGGGGPDGPHGSNYDFLLERNYTARDDTVESEFEYALCYKCHQRISILSNYGFSLHHRHVVDERTPCSACHDPHGISRTQGFGSDHTHLINFDTQIVRPSTIAQRTEFRDLGTQTGSCTLLCHGSEHRDRTYGPRGAE
jgi:predicted CXXCH cytochrome family protein